jgi:hypothetical protein
MVRQPHSGRASVAIRSPWDLFSSTLRTRARLGGERYRSTISRTLSTNRGSFDSSNVWLRCGCKANAAHIRRIVVWEKPLSAAIERTSASRRPVFCATSARSRQQPDRDRSFEVGRASSRRPSQRSFKKRRRHLPTVCSWRPSSAATSLLAKPSAHRRMTRHRSDSDRATR